MTEDRLELATRLWSDLHRLMTEVRDPRREVRQALGLSFVKVKALRRLERHGPLTLRELTDRLTTDPPYTTLVVDDLEEAGLVERRPHPSDRRAKQVHLTPAGREAALRAERILSTPPPELLALDPEELSTVHRLVAVVLARAEEGTR